MLHGETRAQIKALFVFGSLIGSGEDAVTELPLPIFDHQREEMPILRLA